ncbi:MAG: STAS domain-containing protein, partial [Lachnospiraceae bacterium]|nr:STAS domain-containing protein [Lachnospiraceae bacterium]
MTITEVKGEGTIQLNVEGQVDTVTAPELQQKILTSFQKSNDVVLDLGQVGYMSSAGLRALLLGQKTAQSK